MSAEMLRKAAEILRERAATATPGPWQTDGPFWVDPPGSVPSEVTVECRAGVTAGEARSLILEGSWESRDEDAAYIATMHPGVGLALADWLDWTFDQGHSGDMDDNGCDECRPALVVARLILGGAS